MAKVVIEGVFMGASVLESSFNDVVKYSTQIDIYQNDSQEKDKSVMVKSDNPKLAAELIKDFQMGKPIRVSASVNAYKNQAYYKLIEVLK